MRELFYGTYSTYGTMHSNLIIKKNRELYRMLLLLFRFMEYKLEDVSMKSARILILLLVTQWRNKSHTKLPLCLSTATYQRTKGVISSFFCNGKYIGANDTGCMDRPQTVTVWSCHVRSRCLSLKFFGE